MKRSHLALALVASILAAAGLAALPEPAPAEGGASVESPVEGKPAQAAATVVEQAPAGASLFQPGRLRSPFDSSLARARDRLLEGKADEAWSLLAGAKVQTPQAALLKGLAALQAGKNLEAAQLLAPLPGRLPALADRIDWHLGLARERYGDREGAALAWSRVPEGSARKDEARLGQARMLVALGQQEQALEILGPLLERRPPNWGNDYGATALDLAARIHAGRGEKEKARALWMKVWSERALVPEAAEAGKQAMALGAKPSLAQQVARAQVYLDAHRNAEGAKQIEPLLPKLKLPEPLACQARFALGRGYRKMREHRKAIPMLEEVVAKCADPALQVRALYILGQSATIVAPEKALGVYEKITSRFPDHSFADDALISQSELHVRAGEKKKARQALVRLVEDYPQGDYRADALFRLYWLDRSEGDEEKGLGWLRILERDYREDADTTLVERSLYWQGRSLAGLERPVEAAAAWETLIRQHPAGYYAMLARGRLSHVAPELAEALASAHPAAAAEAGDLVLRDDALAADPHYQAALELLRLGFKQQAADELLLVDRKAARERAGSDEPVLLVAWLLDRAESRRAAHHIARTELRHLIRGVPAGDAAAHYRIAYPLAYRDLIVRHSDAFDVPADLMQALMREESSLDPQVVSWAGAVGLTQLMPSTARAVARQLDLREPSTAQLRDPDLNVRLGTAYLGGLLQRWKGNPALAVASYNAGPGAVSRWLKERGHLEMDEFVEEIPIEETRNYVKRVLDSFTTYRLTYGEGEERFVALVPTRANGKALQ